MLVIVHNTLASYWMPLSNELGQSLGGQQADVLTRDTHRKRRRRSVPWQDVSFEAEMLRTVGIAHCERAFDVSFGVSRSLSLLVRRRPLGSCGAAMVGGNAASAFLNQSGLLTTVVRNVIGLPALHGLSDPSAGAPYSWENFHSARESTSCSKLCPNWCSILREP